MILPSVLDSGDMLSVQVFEQEHTNFFIHELTSAGHVVVSYMLIGREHFFKIRMLIINMRNI